MKAGVAIAFIALLPLPAQAARAAPPIPCARVAGGSGTVASITGPLTFKLDNGSEVALAELGLPDEQRTHPAADAAREALRLAVSGGHVALYFEAKPALREDRHGRALAQVLVLPAAGPGPYWLQARLVEEGAALVDSWATNRVCAAYLIPIENDARLGGQGLWADQANLPLPAERAGEARGRFALVEGKIVAAKKLGNRYYLDFSDDWRKGFGVTIDAKSARLFDEEHDPLSLQGAVVRVRGYVDWGSGPEIAVTHPEMIEVLMPGDDRSGDVAPPAVPEN